LVDLFELKGKFVLELH